MTESLLLSVTGALLGLVIAKWSVKVMLAAAPGTVPRSENIGLNTPVILFALEVSVAVAGLFGLFPALKSSKANVQGALKEGGRGLAGGHQRTQHVLGVVQVALALVLLTGGGLLFRTIQNLWAVNRGFNQENVITFQVGLPREATLAPAGIRVAYQRLRERLRQIPGVWAADISALVPLVADQMKAHFGLVPTNRHPWQKYRERSTTRLVPIT